MPVGQSRSPESEFDIGPSPGKGSGDIPNRICLLGDGRLAGIRDVNPVDHAALAALYRSVSVESRRARFHGMTTILSTGSGAVCPRAQLQIISQRVSRAVTAD